MLCWSDVKHACGLVNRGFLVCRKETLMLEYPKEGRFVYPEKADASKEGVEAEGAAVI